MVVESGWWDAARLASKFDIVPRISWGGQGFRVSCDWSCDVVAVSRPPKVLVPPRCWSPDSSVLTARTSTTACHHHWACRAMDPFSFRTSPVTIRTSSHFAVHQSSEMRFAHSEVDGRRDGVSQCLSFISFRWCSTQVTSKH